MFDTHLNALVAAGGNSRAARSARARMQLRDRYGRFAWMGGGLKFKVRGANGRVHSVIGSFIGAKDEETGQVYVRNDSSGLPDGFYDVKSNNAEVITANLPEDFLRQQGIDPNESPSERVAEQIPDITQMRPKAAPEGWQAVPGTFNKRRVIESEDGDFRIHFGGADASALLEDHRAAPGEAVPQRSVAEAFRKVSDVDAEREASGDDSYSLSEGNEEALAGRTRDDKIDQIKTNERTLLNDRAPLPAKQAAMDANNTLKKELEDEGQPYDPEGEDSDEALEARKAAAKENPSDISAGGIDTSTFDVAPEGFLVPTGKSTNDISPEGLATFISAEKEHLGKGGARLVVDTDNNTAEIYNSADTVEDAKAQAGGLGKDTVLDLSTGQPVQVSEGAVDPNSPDVNPNLNGDTSPEAPNAEDRNPDAVEPERADTGADAPASPEPDAEAQRPAEQPAADTPDGGDNADAPGRPDNGAADGGERSAAAPGSVEDLKERRAKIQAALDNAGDPKDIIALNEQADALDNRIQATSTPAPDQPEGPRSSGDVSRDMETNERSREEALRLLNESEGDPLALNNDDYKRLEALATEQERKQDKLENTLDRLQNDVIPALEKEYEDLLAQLDEANGVQELDFDADRTSPAEPEVPEDTALTDLLEAAWLQSDGLSDSAIDRREHAALRILRNGNEKGDLEGAKNRLSPEEQDALSDEVARAIGFDRPEPAEASAPAEVPDAYEEPGDSEALSQLRQRLSEFEAGLDEEIEAAENAPNPQEAAEHLAKVKTYTRRVKELNNAINRVNGNQPIDLNKELGWSMRDPENRGSFPEAPESAWTPDNTLDAPEEPVADAEGTPAVLDDTIQPEPAPERPEWLDEDGTIDFDKVPEDTRTPEEKVADAEDAVAEAERKYAEVLLRDDYTDEEYEKALEDRDDARDLLDARIEERDYMDAAQMEEAEMEDRWDEDGSDADAPALPNTSEGWAKYEQDLEDLRARLEGRDAGEAGGAVDRADDPDRVSPGHENRVAAAKAKMQGKEMSDEERADIEAALDSETLSDNLLSRIEADIDLKANRANTLTVARPEREQPATPSPAALEIINAEREDPNYVFDEDLTWRTIQENFPDAEVMPNGDLRLESHTAITKEGKPDEVRKRYDVMIRRTDRNRFMPYIIETLENGDRRAKRVGPSEWHSYEALNKRIERARTLASGKRPSSWFANNTETPSERLGRQDFPEDSFLGDIGNPNAPLPATGDDRYDMLLGIAANHIRNGDANLDQITEHLREIAKEEGINSNTVSTIMQSIIGAAYDRYTPDGGGATPFQMYNGEMAEIGMDVDWTDWHQELDWWLPNGSLNPKRRANPDYGKVRRGRIMGYVGENKDGKGHTYGDHVWVQFYDSNGRRVGTQVKRSAQTLRLVDEGSAPGLPFFSKREEWRSSPEAIARHFGVPAPVQGEPVVTHERPNRDLPQGRTLKFTSRGSLAGYSNVAVPQSKIEIAQALSKGDLSPQFRPASEVRPGMFIRRLDADGNQNVDTVIRVENVGNGKYRIHAARPDGNGNARVDSFLVPENMTVEVAAPRALPAPADRSFEERRDERRGESVEYTQLGQTFEGVIVREEPDGTFSVANTEGGISRISGDNIKTLGNAVVPKSDRDSLFQDMQSYDLPPQIQAMIMKGIFSPGLSQERYKQLLEIVEAFGAKNVEIGQADRLLDMIGATPQQRADVHDFITAPTE